VIDAIEQLMIEHFRSVPFHNLNLLYGQPINEYVLGGTCSDKTLAFLRDIRGIGANAHLHSAFIGGEEIHRLVRVTVNGRDLFADIGNGWPSLKLFPAYKIITYECFGMKYRTEISGDWVRVFHTKQGKESLQMEINVIPRPEAEIREQINTRYSSGIEYPFMNSLRFSLIVGEEFLFLRGNRLECYSEEDFIAVELGSHEIPKIIRSKFGIDVSSYFDKAVQ
jgi:arylamine N-acetyltransferase